MPAALLVLMALVAGVARASPGKYSAFDLAGKKGIPLFRIGPKTPADVDMTVYLEASLTRCKQALVKDGPGRMLSVEKDSLCELYSQTSPTKFSFRVAAAHGSTCPVGAPSPWSAGCSLVQTIDFDDGQPVAAEYRGYLWMTDKLFDFVQTIVIDVCIARMGPQGWEQKSHKLVRADGRVRTKEEFEGLPAQGTAYLRLGGCSFDADANQVFRVNYAPPPRRTEIAAFPANRSEIVEAVYAPERAADGRLTLRDCNKSLIDAREKMESAIKERELAAEELVNSGRDRASGQWDSAKHAAAWKDYNDKAKHAADMTEAHRKEGVKVDPYPGAAVAWKLYIDQANESGTPRITHNPNNYISANSFGRIRVRHWKNVVPYLVTSGTGTAFTLASAEGGTTFSSPTPGIGSSHTCFDGDAAVSEIIVPPRAPGTLNLIVKFQDVSGAPVKDGSSDASKAPKEIGMDIIVDRSYSSGFRFGLGKVFRLSDVRYFGRQMTKDGPYTIDRKESPAHEIILGYSLFLDWLAGGGRGYALRNTDAWGWIKNHLGFYAGFGALSYSSDNLDFLKSMHLGLEFEFARNFSIAATFAIRRTPALVDGFYVGDKIPTSSIETRDEYRTGIGVVLNFSTEFLLFVAKGGK